LDFDMEEEGKAKCNAMSSCYNYLRRSTLAQWVYKIILVLILSASGFLCIWMALHPQTLKDGLETVRKLGIWGNVILGACYIIIAFPVAVGYTAVGLACGFLYGPWIGVLTTFIGAQVVGSSISFLVMWNSL